MSSFSYVRGFPTGFYTVTRFEEASGDIGFPVLLLFIALHRSVFYRLSYLSLVSMKLRPRGSVRMRRPGMMDGAPAKTAGRLGASDHPEMDPTDGSVVHLVLACTPCHWVRGCVL